MQRRNPCGITNIKYFGMILKNLLFKKGKYRGDFEYKKYKPNPERSRKISTPHCPSWEITTHPDAIFDRCIYIAYRIVAKRYKCNRHPIRNVQFLLIDCIIVPLPAMTKSESFRPVRFSKAQISPSDAFLERRKARIKLVKYMRSVPPPRHTNRVSGGETCTDFFRQGNQTIDRFSADRHSRG